MVFYEHRFAQPIYRLYSLKYKPSLIHYLTETYNFNILRSLSAILTLNAIITYFIR